MTVNENDSINIFYYRIIVTFLLRIVVKDPLMAAEVISMQTLAAEVISMQNMVSEVFTMQNM